jgi:hypothetical protein
MMNREEAAELRDTLVAIAASLWSPEVDEEDEYAQGYRRAMVELIGYATHDTDEDTDVERQIIELSIVARVAERT